MAARKKLTAEEEKEIKLLQANNEMLEKTKEEARLRGNAKSVQRIQIAQNDVIEQIKKIDKNLADKVSKSNNNEPLIDNSDDSKLLENKKTSTVETADDDYQSVYDALEDNALKLQSVSKDTASTISNTNEEVDLGSILHETSQYEFNNVDADAQYDVIPLPSNGEGYKSKMSRVPVAYLTAYDENFITSPNLYKDGLIIDFLLKNKIMNKDIDIDSLYSGDVDAIILFLRATSYGPEFPITARDPESGEKIDTVVDLTTLKSKEFTLKGDENGLFDFELPVSKDKIKFRFLTRKDERNLKMLNKLENDNTKGTFVEKNVNDLKDSIKTDSTLSGQEKQKFIDDLNKISAWATKLKESARIPVSKMITNRMEMNIVSVNGETDRKFIAKYVKNMGTRDSLTFRKYVLANEPGIDFEIEVQRPENLGGGSFKTFLEWDDTVFLNIA